MLTAQIQLKGLELCMSHFHAFEIGHFNAPGLKDPLGHLVIGSSVRNSIPLTNKVQYFVWVIKQ